VESQDYPIQHFKSMILLANSLKIPPARILELARKPFDSWIERRWLDVRTSTAGGRPAACLTPGRPPVDTPWYMGRPQLSIDPLGSVDQC
jgi:hypothetical protein